MKCYRYILNEEGKPVPEPDLFKWARWLETADRTVAFDRIGHIRVSTVFLGLDPGFGQPGHLVLWETMVFGGRLDLHKQRCPGAREQAEAMHADMVAVVKHELATTGGSPTDDHEAIERIKQS